MAFRYAPASSFQACTESLKDALAGHRLHFSLDDFSMSSLRFFQPRALDVGIGRTVKLGDQPTDQFCFIFETQ